MDARATAANIKEVDGKWQLHCSACDKYICDGRYHANKAHNCKGCKDKMPKKNLVFALDHDDTYTADPELWDVFIETAFNHGHTVSFVTYRCSNWDNRDIEANAAKHGIPIVYTEARQKKHVFTADIWIDDSPEMCASFDDMEGLINGCKDMGDTH